MRVDDAFDALLKFVFLWLCEGQWLPLAAPVPWVTVETAGH